MGPIGNAGYRERAYALDDILIYDMHDLRDQIEDFWTQALDASDERIVWLSRWSAQEYCGFLQWLYRNGDGWFRLADLSDVTIPVPNAPYRQVPVKCASLVRAEEFADNALWDLARTPPQGLLDAWRLLWRKLAADDAPLRVITEAGLVSAPLDYFDADLLKHVGRRWVTASRVVGSVLADMMDGFRKGGVYQCGDLLLFSRMAELVETGTLEAQGDIYETSFEVRRPQT